MEFNELLRRLTPKLKAIARKADYTHTYFGWDDLYQEAVIHLWREFGAGGLLDKTDSYILQGCYFHLKNYIRTARDRGVAVSLQQGRFDESDPIEDSLLLPAEDGTGRFFDMLNDKMVAEVIYNNGLTAKEKQLLPLFAQGMTTRQIGRRIGVSHVSVVKMRKVIREKCLKHLDGDV